MSKKNKPKAKTTQKTIRNKPQLTEQQIRFCQEYIIDLNGTQAAIRACYSEDTAQEQSSRLLSNVMIQHYVQELLDDRAARTMATADKVISELYHLVSFDPQEVFDHAGCLIRDLRKVPKNIRKAIASIEVTEEFSGTGNSRVWTGYIKKIKFWDKTKAIELLARHHKLITDKHEIAGPNGAPLAAPMIIFEDQQQDPVDGTK